MFEIYQKSLEHLKNMLGPFAEFREGQFEAIEKVLQNKKLLVVQKTGWGKSVVYFIAVKMLRNMGSGPAILISPLLSLMRNQILNAERIGVNAVTLNSSQEKEEWTDIYKNIKEDKCDLILISPERLADKDTMEKLLSAMNNKVGCFIVDEAHCISDWGHDFRPDYRRIVNMVNSLPSNIPVVATTATANDRVINDIVVQLGDIEVMRGPLMRESLRMQVVKLSDQAERLAWLAENIGKMPGSGIVYCLTKAACENVCKWLIRHGINAIEYNTNVDKENREIIEERFLSNEYKCVVATVALGMGYDKPDIGFVIHYQRPGNVISYYQQIGRAGRQISNAYIVLLNGREDDDIQEYFISRAFPTENEMTNVVAALETAENGLTSNQLMGKLNVRKQRLDNCIKYLEVNGVLYKEDGKYYRSLNEWIPDIERSYEVTKRRYAELEEMKQFVEWEGCYMKYLADKLDDKHSANCNKCTNCIGRPYFKTEVNRNLVLEAVDFLRGEYISLSPRKQWPYNMNPDGKAMNIPENYRLQEGRTLSKWGDAGWGGYVQEDKYTNNYFRDEIVEASCTLIKNWFCGSYGDMCVAFIPSKRNPELVKGFAERVALRLGIPIIDIIEKVETNKQQKEMENSSFQCGNALSSFKIRSQCPSCDILLIDDMVDSKWTLTVCGYLLLKNGAKRVYPFALASTAGMR